MKKIKNFNSLPAYFIDIQPAEKGGSSYSRGKLKVFYVGMTADRRQFTEDFSRKLLSTIGFAPVVSHYNAEKDDFEGHAANQEIYGCIDPTVPAVIQTDEQGTSWAICDVIIYDKRQDKTGEIASKIIGHAQSLEMNPDTLKYRIVRNEFGIFDHIEFIEGEFLGVSVLGTDQEPAFTGSAFFDKFDETLFRGKEMNIIIPDFLRVSWGEKGEAIAKALVEKYQERMLWIQDIYDKFVIFSLLTEDQTDYKFYRESFKINGLSAELADDIVEVHPSYEIVPQQSSDEPLPEPSPENEPPLIGEPPMFTEDSGETKPIVEVPANEESAAEDAAVHTVSTESTVNLENQEGQQEKVTQYASIEENAEPLASELTITAKGQNEETEVQSTVTALLDSEREELENYRRKEKEEIIYSYSDIIPETTLQEYRDNLDSYTKENLTNELNAIYVRITREQAKKAPANMTRLSWIPDSKPKSAKEIDEEERLAHVRALLKK